MTASSNSCAEDEDRHVNLSSGSSATDGKHSRSQMSLKITHLRGKNPKNPKNLAEEIL